MPKRLPGYLLILSLLVLAGVRPAAATNIYHVVFDHQTNYYDTFADFEAYQLSSDYPSDPDASISFEQWRCDAGSSCNAWTEVGLIQGNFKGSYWSGGFGAGYNSTYGLFSFTLGSENGESSVPQTSLAVTTGNTYQVQYHFDGKAYNYVTTSNYYSDDMEVGVESHSDSSDFENSYSEGMYSHSEQTYVGGPSWNYWPASVGYADDSPDSQYATYGIQNGIPYASWWY